MAKEKRGYEGHVFGCLPNGGFMPCDRLIKVSASSLDEAMPLIESTARAFLEESRFPQLFPQIHIDRVNIASEATPVYQAIWDETGPLAAYRNAAA